MANPSMTLRTAAMVVVGGLMLPTDASAQFPYFSQSGKVPMEQAVAPAGYTVPDMMTQSVLSGDPAAYGHVYGGLADATGGYGSEADCGDSAGCSSCGPMDVGPCDASGACPLVGGPYGDGTCAPHWFDVYAEYMYMKREEISRFVPFASDDISGPIVLSTDDLQFDEESGFRVTGTYQVAANAHLEASYFGTFFWSSAAEAPSASNNLYSVLSNFGTQPPGGFLQTDQAALQSIDYQSELNSVELNWRHHWMSSNYWFHGSWLAGARYVRLEEEFRYMTVVNAHDDPLTPPVDPNERGPADMNYRVATTNDLVGFQLGSDIFMCMLPGLVVGAELKAGVYGNMADQDTAITATNLNPPVAEALADQDVAFVGEAGVMAIYQLFPWLSLRGGYQLLYLDGIALAPENFNTVAPFPPFSSNRTVFLNDNGDAFYHGFTAGLECLW